MKIGYRRFAGKAFVVGDKVTSKRGAWLEKRTALFKTLEERGNEVTIIKNGDEYTGYDIILMEFGSNNYNFYKEDIDYSTEILRTQKCIFILDDPDLFPEVVKENGFKPIFWVNADPQICQRYWCVVCEHFPVFGLQEMREPTPEHNGKIVYYGGSSGGREKKLLQYKTLIGTLEVVGQKKDFVSIKPKEPPIQEHRRNFYQQYMASLVLRDALHKKLGWNTGRKFHSILAGCPALDEDENLLMFAEQMHDKDFRHNFIKQQQESLRGAKKQCEDILEKYGM